MPRKVKLSRALLVLMLAAAICLGLSACHKNDGPPPPASDSSQTAIRDGSLRLPLLSLPYTFNPDAMDEDADAISENLFSRLVCLTSTGDLLPDLATEWSFNDDATVLNLKLRKGVLWHDGRPFTAEDVVWTLTSIRSQRGVLYDQFSQVKEIWLSDAETVHLSFSTPSPLFLYTLAEPGASILPQHLYQDQDWLTAEAVTHPIGTGPFYFQERNPDTGQVILARNDGYYGGRPALNRLVFQYYPSAAEARAAFERGELEVLTVGLPLSSLKSYEENPAVTLLSVDDATRIQLAFNVAEGSIFRNNPMLRFAVAHAIDREELLSVAMQGIGAVSTHFLSPTFEQALLQSATVPEYNARQSDSYLSNLYSKNDSGRYVRLTLSVCDVEPYPEIAAVLKRQLGEVGIDLTVIQTDREEWEATVVTSGEYEMTLYGGYQGPYPEAILHRVAIGGQLNISGYQNTTVSNRLYAAIAQPNIALRRNALRQVQQLLAEQIPFLPLLEWYTVTPVASYVENPPQLSDTVSKNDYSKTSLRA